jgi:spore maturation protein CgeB
VESTTGHHACFQDGKEAVFFSSVAECAERIRAYLPDETARSEIARAGNLRCRSSGYSNDERIKQALRHVYARMARTRNLGR